jgi:hypothetical protein
MDGGYEVSDFFEASLNIFAQIISNKLFPERLYRKYLMIHFKE